MARNQESVTCPPGEWTQLTNGDISEITFQVVTGSVKIRATVGATAPAASAEGYVYHARPGDEQSENGELRIDIADLTATAGANRVYARPISGRKARVIVDHA
jgi:hypothetical protein